MSPPQLMVAYRMGMIDDQLHCRGAIVSQRHVYEFYSFIGADAWLVRNLPVRVHVRQSQCESTDDYRALAGRSVYAVPEYYAGLSNAENACLMKAEGTLAVIVREAPVELRAPFFLCWSDPGMAYAMSAVVRLRVSAIGELPDVRAAMIFDGVFERIDPFPGAEEFLADTERAAARMSLPLGCPIPIELIGPGGVLSGILRLDTSLSKPLYRATIVLMDVDGQAHELGPGALLRRRVKVPRFIGSSAVCYRNDTLLEAVVAELVEPCKLVPLVDFAEW